MVFTKGYPGFPGEKHYNWKGGITERDEYILVKKRDHPFRDGRGYVRQHRLIMEEHLGRYLESWEEVHHINGDRSDNRLENLQLMTKSEHTLHHNECRRVELGARICFVCNSNTTYYNPHHRAFVWFDCGDNKWACKSCFEKTVYHNKQK